MRALLCVLLVGCNGLLSIEKATLDPGVDSAVTANDTSVEDTTPTTTDAMERCANPWKGKACTAATECTAPEQCIRGHCIDNNWAYWPIAITHSYSVYDAVVVDNVTCLIWQKDSDPTGRSWSDASRYCRDLELGGFTDWRLPTRMELASLQEPDKGPPGIDNKVFSDVPTCGAFCAAGNWFWVTKEINASEAITVRFDGNGGFGPQPKSSAYRVRCVR